MIPRVWAGRRSPVCRLSQMVSLGDVQPLLPYVSGFQRPLGRSIESRSPVCSGWLLSLMSSMRLVARSTETCDGVWTMYVVSHPYCAICIEHEKTMIHLKCRQKSGIAFAAVGVDRSVSSVLDGMLRRRPTVPSLRFSAGCFADDPRVSN